MNSKKTQLLRSFLKGSRILFLTAMLASVLSALCDMISPQIVRVAVDNVLGGADPEALPAWVRSLAERTGGFSWLAEHIWVMALALVAVALVRAAAQYSFRVANTAASERLVKNARDSLFRRLVFLPAAWYREHRTGDIIQRCTSDLETLKNFISEQLTGFLRIVILLALSVGFMFAMNWKLAMIALLPVPFIILYSFYFHRKIGEAFLACDENEGVLSTQAQENLTGIRVVRAFGQERLERTRFEKQNDYYTSLWMKLAVPLARYWSTGDILSGTQILLTVCFGAAFCVRGEMLAGEYIAFLSYCAMMTWPVRMLGRMISEMSKAGVSLERIREILDGNEEDAQKSSPGEKPIMDGDICFDRVSYTYGEGEPVLKDLSFIVPGGSTLGILGGTGSGKSTLVMLLEKFYSLPEENGSIRIGDMDIRQIQTAWLREHIALVLQEPFLFSGSIRDNLLLTAESADDAAIDGALSAACLKETVESFADGLDTLVGERGVTLSGGQKQRVAIAQALLRSAPIMILDDSLSAVDAETDARIRAALRERFQGITVILISHRIATLKNADQILVLDHGRITEQGTHEQLRSAGGLYQRICEIQEDAG